MQVYLAVVPGEQQEASKYGRSFAHVAYRIGPGSTLLRQNLLLQTRGGLLSISDREAPLIEESPVNIECRTVQILELGSHHMFVAEVLGVDVDDKYLDKNGKFQLNQAGLMVYSHGEYFGLGKKIGKFGYSVRRKK